MLYRNMQSDGVKLKKEFKIPVVRVGYEPASDNDMLICELNGKTVDLEDVISKLMNV